MVIDSSQQILQTVIQGIEARDKRHLDLLMILYMIKRKANVRQLVKRMTKI